MGRTRELFRLLFVLAIAVATSGCGGGTLKYVVRAQPVPRLCDWLDGSAANATCFRVERPRGGVAGGPIELPVTVFAAKDAVRSPPLVLITGGPGESTHDTFADALISGALDELRREREIVLVEQRGARLASPFLECTAELRAATVARLTRAPLTERGQELYREAARTCHERWTSQGVDLSAYSTEAAANDIAAVMRALRYAQYDVYGISYGGLVASRVAALDPRVRSLVLDSTPHPSFDYVRSRGATTEAVLAKLFRRCERDPICNATYPRLGERFFDHIERLDIRPLEVEVHIDGAPTTILLSGSRFLDRVAQALYLHDTPERFGALVESWISSSGHEGVARAVITDLSRMGEGSWGLTYSVLCQELEGEVPEMSAAAFGRWQRDSVFIESICEEWDSTHRRVPMTRVSARTLVLSGAFDPVISEAQASALHQALGAERVVFANASHGLFGYGECQLMATREFLDTGNVSAMRACADQ